MKVALGYYFIDHKYLITAPSCNFHPDLTRKQPCMTTLSSERSKDRRIIAFLWPVWQLLPFYRAPPVSYLHPRWGTNIFVSLPWLPTLLRGVRKELWYLCSCPFVSSITHRIPSFRRRLHKYFLLAEFILSRFWSFKTGTFLRKACKSVCFYGRTESCFQASDGSKVILLFT